MMPRKFDRILEDCLARMDRGESLMEILSVYPAQAEKLKPLLLVAMLGRALPHPVPGYTALRLGKNELLAEMASMQADGGFLEPKPVEIPRDSILDRWARSLKRLQPTYRFAMLSLVVVLAGGFFTLSASASGLAENIMQTLFFSFEQVGDMLLIQPSLPKAMGESPVFTNKYDLPETPDDYSGDSKGLMVDDEDGKLIEIVVVDDELEVNDKDLEEEEKDEEKDLEEEEKDEEKDLEEEEKDEEKDLEEEEKDEEKDLEEEEKDEEKDLKEEEKDEEKDLKEEEKEEEKDLKEDEKEAEKEEDIAEKEAEKEEKEAEKEEDIAEKEAEKEEKEDEKDKDK